MHPSDKDCVSRPRASSKKDNSQDGDWKSEVILILGHNKIMQELASRISYLGASVDFQCLECLQDLYKIPLEQYTLLIITDKPFSWNCNVLEVIEFLGRLDERLVVVWASETFEFSSVSRMMNGRVQLIELALPVCVGMLTRILRSLQN